MYLYNHLYIMFVVSMIYNIRLKCLCVIHIKIVINKFCIFFLIYEN